jgi:hypothetical protein
MPDSEMFDARALRGRLAEERLTVTRFATACGLSRAFLYHVLSERQRPGELARIKIERGMQRLGLESEANRVA